MINHKHKCIFIHIPKTAGSSIISFLYPNVKFHFENADYERLFGWCPKRKIHMQHATSKQLLETGLISKKNWNDYYKFTFIRNPWDRAYSDYKWMKKFAKIKGSFREYIFHKGEFDEILNNAASSSFLGDHVLNQSDFFDQHGDHSVDFIGKFENLSEDIAKVLNHLKISNTFNKHLNKSKKRYNHYSYFYTKTFKELVQKKYKTDIERFRFKFEDKKKGIYKLKKIL